MVRDKRACEGSRATWARALDWGCPVLAASKSNLTAGTRSLPPQCTDW